MGHIRIHVHPYAVGEHLVDGLSVAHIHQLHIPPLGDHEANVDASATGGDELEQYRIIGKVGIFDIDVSLRAANGSQLCFVDLGILSARVEYSDGVFVCLSRCFAFVEVLEERGQIAEHSALCPRTIGFAGQLLHHGALQPDHQVVPVVAVLATDVHASQESYFAIDDRDLGVIAGEPRVGQGTHVHRGTAAQILGNGGRWVECRRHAVRVRELGGQRANAIHRHLHVDFARAPSEKIGDLNGEVVVVEDVSANVNGLARLLDAVDECREVLVTVDEKLERARQGCRIGDRVELPFPFLEIHARAAGEWRNRQFGDLRKVNHADEGLRGEIGQRVLDEKSQRTQCGDRPQERVGGVGLEHVAEQSGGAAQVPGKRPISRGLDAGVREVDVAISKASARVWISRQELTGTRKRRGEGRERRQQQGAEGRRKPCCHAAAMLSPARRCCHGRVPRGCPNAAP